MLLDTFSSLQKKLKKDGFDLEILTELKSGKEATVFAVLLKQEILAMKFYHLHRDLKTRDDYTSGRFYRSKAEGRSIQNKTRLGKRLAKNNWIKREFSLLNRLFQIGVSVPKPVLQFENCIFMDFIGDKTSLVPAQKLKDVNLSLIQAKNTFNQLIQNLKLCLKFGVVHGDLSPYNILWKDEQIWLIDFPQSVDIRHNPQFRSFLERDISHLVKYFRPYFELDIVDLTKDILADMDKQL